MSKREKTVVEVEITHPDKVLFPGEKITKGQLIEYYRRVAPVMLPHVEGRPITMHRYPRGLRGTSFIQQEAPEYFPAWIRREPVEKREGGITDRVVVDRPETLVYLANQACLTIHTWLSRAGRLEFPDRLVFDLDPPEGGFSLAVFAARELRRLLTEELEMLPFVMTTGSRGLHLAIPLDGRADFDAVREFAREVAEVMVQRHPDRLTAEVRLAKRGGRLFLDTARNAYGQTAVAPYSVRAKPGAPVATPLEWKELEADLEAQKYTVNNLFAHLDRRGDPWEALRQQRFSLVVARSKLDRLRADFRPEPLFA
ncbi:MAG: ATP-dependent DNA ligase [Candidatus Zixiibacteriota bacterium]|nr:MAG: ATP-dependent DNA ligase [candidate division Zixibacteria bacterium]